MTTLYVRDVPAEVAATLKERAAAEGKSLSAYVVAELGRIASRPTNAEIVERLRQLDRLALAEALGAPLHTCDAKLDSGIHQAVVHVHGRTH